jgi:hypothetical protein
MECNTITGKQLLEDLTKAGLDPAKLDLRRIVGTQSVLDVAELELLLHGAETARQREWPDITIIVNVKL